MHAAAACCIATRSMVSWIDREIEREHNLCELRPGVTWFVEQATIQTEGEKSGNTWNDLVQSHELNI